MILSIIVCVSCIVMVESERLSRMVGMIMWFRFFSGLVKKGVY